MKAVVSIFLLQFGVAILQGQTFYLRGEVRDESGNLLQNVTVQLLSTGYVYHTGNQGSFGIPVTHKTDTLLFTFPGFQEEKKMVTAEQFIQVVMKLLPAAATNIKKDKLLSLTRNLSREEQKKWYSGHETYASLVENNFIDTQKFPETSVALNIDRASYSNTRRFINLDMKVPPDAVRIEELLNNFNFGYHAPADSACFRLHTQLTSCAWNPDNLLFFISGFSKKLNLDSLPPTHLVFLVDISGSMDMPNRLPLLKSAFRLLVMNLREKDTVSIVIYGGAVGVKLFPTSGAEKEIINKAIDELTPGGSTPGEAGIKLAYQLAKKHFIKGGNNRVVLATDGDFNVGVNSEQELDELISRHRQSGIYLTCLGVGMGNYKDSKIQTLARKGNGNFAYLDTYQEAEKILMKEFTQTLYTVADEVTLTVRFDPSIVKRYRLIGFDNKVSALSDSTTVVEGGEIGSGQSFIVALELEPAFQFGANISSGQFARIGIHYRLPNDSTLQELSETIPFDPIVFKELDPKFRLATAVLMYGMKLKNSPYANEISWGDVLYQASEAANSTDVNESQFVELVYKTKLLYTRSKKKKKNN